ncbi:hypothetical protein J2Y69_001094 [Microbacterium resistens]|uniref:Uncharacterized protein n=1 Tax=Microbacterium resistens TaxID=156977 RepID=A0ABU1SA61_9MICO|nr:hypothetical protein [Microbacterium resistens]MDR6866501.1 hypothetical protein [Microbacterium resistens]
MTSAPASACADPQHDSVPGAPAQAAAGSGVGVGDGSGVRDGSSVGVGMAEPSPLSSATDPRRTSTLIRYH